jgi:hypothetical protein
MDMAGKAYGVACIFSCRYMHGPSSLGCGGLDGLVDGFGIDVYAVSYGSEVLDIIGVCLCV